MKSWRSACRDGLVSGSTAAAASALALMLAGRLSPRGAVAPVNAPSHWIWGRRAIRADGVSLRHTVAGYAIHHAAGVFWGVVYERWLAADGDGRPLPVMLRAGSAAGLACFVDYCLTPERFRPGFEHHLSRPALAGVYAAIALGLGGATLWRRMGTHLEERATGGRMSTQNRPLREQAVQGCIDECRHCEALCRRTAASGDPRLGAAQLELLSRCAGRCAAAAQALLEASPGYVEACRACAEACDACAGPCERAGLDDCADACRSCAQTCRTMSLRT